MQVDKRVTVMPRGFCWFWWMAAPYRHPYVQRFWRPYSLSPWARRWAWIYGQILFALPPMTEEQEIAILEEQKRLIEEELKYISERLEELKK